MFLEEKHEVKIRMKKKGKEKSKITKQSVGSMKLTNQEKNEGKGKERKLLTTNHILQVHNDILVNDGPHL